MQSICRFQLLKCNDLLLFTVLYNRKLIIFWLLVLLSLYLCTFNSPWWHKWRLVVGLRQTSIHRSSYWVTEHTCNITCTESYNLIQPPGPPALLIDTRTVTSLVSSEPVRSSCELHRHGFGRASGRLGARGSPGLQVKPAALQGKSPEPL